MRTWGPNLSTPVVLRRRLVAFDTVTGDTTGGTTDYPGRCLVLPAESRDPSVETMDGTVDSERRKLMFAPSETGGITPAPPTKLPDGSIQRDSVLLDSVEYAVHAVDPYYVGGRVIAMALQYHEHFRDPVAWARKTREPAYPGDEGLSAPTTIYVRRHERVEQLEEDVVSTVQFALMPEHEPSVGDRIDGAKIVRRASVRDAPGNVLWWVAYGTE